MEKKIEKKLRVVRFIPAIVIKYNGSVKESIVTSACLYEDKISADLALSSLLKMYRDHPSYSVVRWSIIRKVFAL